MNDVPEEETGAVSPGTEAGMLANLPRTRPQRASARRAAARKENVALDAPIPDGGERSSARPKPRRGTKAIAVKARPARGARDGAPATDAGAGAGAGESAITSAAAGQSVANAPATGGGARAATAGAGRKPAGARAKQDVKAEQDVKAKHGTKAKQGAKARATAGARRRVTPRSEEEPVPRQGFASEEEPMIGAVQPPGGAELLASATEILGELAKSGLSTGERLLKDVLSRFSPS